MYQFKTKYGEAIIREANRDDYPQIAGMFADNHLYVPMWSEIEKLSMVATIDDKVVAYIWACVGNCTTAYLDHLLVDEDYRDDKDKESGRSVVGLQIGIELLRNLIRRGTTRVVCTLMDDFYGRCMARLYQDAGFQIVNSLGVARGNIHEVTTGLMKRLSNAN